MIARIGTILAGFQVPDIEYPFEMVNSPVVLRPITTEQSVMVI